MATRMLNSGNLNDYMPIGEDGVLVWQRAEAFRASIQNARQFSIIPTSEKNKNEVLDLSKNSADPYSDKTSNDSLNPEHKSLGQLYADHLAIPRASADGKRIDWYVPFNPKNGSGDYDVVSWNAASVEEKKAALEILNQFYQDLKNFGNDLEVRSLTSNDKLFAHFLTGNKDNFNIKTPAIHFPDESYVYIVNGIPVITFWGFIHKGAKLDGAPFDCLNNFLKTTNSTKVNETLHTTNATATAQTANVVKTGFAHWPCLLTALLLLLLLPFLLYLLWWYFYGKPLPLFKSFPDLPNMSLEPIDIDGNKLSLDGVDVNLPNVDLPNVKLPNVDLPKVGVDGDVVDTADDGVVATSTDDTSNENSDTPKADDILPQDNLNNQNDAQDNAQNDDNKLPADDENKKDDNNKLPPPQLSDDANANKDDLQKATPPQLSDDKVAKNAALSNDDLTSGDITKLDGNWKVNSPIVDRYTNKPLQLQYDFKDGKGTATITQKNGVKCVGNVKGGLKQGTLNIDSESEAKCTDGSVYTLPTVKCQTGKNGNSDCTSSYQNSSAGSKYEFPMTIHR